MTQKTVGVGMAVAVLGAIDPDAYAAGTYTSGWISAANWQDFAALVAAGDIGAGGTIDAKIEQATSAGGAGAKDVPLAAITQLTQAGTDSNKQAVISFSASDLDVNNGYTHFRLSMTVGTAASDAGGMVVGMDARFGNAAGGDATTVDEIVTL